MGCNTSKEAVAVQPTAPAMDMDGSMSKPMQQEEEEEVDIDLDDPEVQGAATKIQAVFRGHRARKDMRTDDGDCEQPAEQHKDVSQPEEPQSEPVVDFTEEFSPDDKELCHAAVKIQASFRGHMARKQQGKPDDELSKELEKLDAKGAEEEELDIDLTDPDLHKAATKIQASFRGHKVRKTDEKTEEGEDGKDTAGQ